MLGVAWVVKDDPAGIGVQRDLGQDVRGLAREAVIRSQRRQVRADVDGVDGAEPLAEAQAQKLAAAFTDYLQACRAAGLSACAPVQFLMPGDLAGSPALTFSPLKAGDAPCRSLAREMARRFEAYKAQVVYPFFWIIFRGLIAKLFWLIPSGQFIQGRKR